jgi:hypothetical protein
MKEKIIKYKIDKWQVRHGVRKLNVIEKIECEGEIKVNVEVNGEKKTKINIKVSDGMYRKVTENIEYYDSYLEAKDFIITTIKNRITTFEKELKEEKEYYSKMVDIEEDD